MANVSDLTSIASLCVVVGCTLLCATQMSRAQTTGQTGKPEVGGSLVDRSNPGLGRPNPLQLPKPLRDANGNLLHHSGRPIEIIASPVHNSSDLDRRHAGVHPMGILCGGDV